MKNIFINFSNHPVALWSEEQKEAAYKYGENVEIQDVIFPMVKAESTEEDIANIGESYIKEILGKSPVAVMCQGEFGLVYYVVSRLKQHNINVVYACSERVAAEEILEDGRTRKQLVFRFVQFRKY